MNIPTTTTLHELHEYFGIPSWFDLWKVIVERDLQDREWVELMQTPKASAVMSRIMVPVANPDQVISRRFVVAEVKALAFDEIYQHLPLPASKALIQDIVREIATYGGRHMATDVHTFVDNIPTRHEASGD